MTINRPQFKNRKVLTHSRVHYLWAINELNEKRGYARAVDVANLLGISRSAVSTALAQLKSMQLVVEKYPEHFLKLTPIGKKHLDNIDNKFILLSRFFKSYLGLDEKTATQQACLIEHLLLDEVAQKINNLLNTSSPFSSDTINSSIKPPNSGRNSL
jgi:Mn-dependent DtxR family transcriptional regulator